MWTKKFQLKESQRKRREAGLKKQLADAALRGEVVEEQEGMIVGPAQKTPQQKVRDKVRTARAWTHRPSRIFDLLDGGRATFDGIWHRTFYDEAKRAKAETLRWKHQRYGGFEATMRSLGLTYEGLEEEVSVPGVLIAQGKFTVQRAIPPSKGRHLLQLMQGRISSALPSVTFCGQKGSAMS